MINLAHKLRNIRESHGLTVRDLHDLSGIAVGTIYRIENGDLAYKVNDCTAKALADALYLDVYDIFEPHELSPYGRPPMTGCPISPKHSQPEKVCPGCNYALPATGVCDDCGVMPLAG